MSKGELKMKQAGILSVAALPLMAFLCLMIFASTAFAAQTAVNLGTAGGFAVLAKSGISTTGTTSIVGDIGVSPIAASSITGFGLILDSSNQFATSSLLNGKAYAANYAPPTPAKMTTAIGDMQTAYTDAAGRTNPTATELGAGNIGGMTLAPGLYKWGTGVSIPTGVTLSGGPNDVWIFQIAQNLDVGNGAIVTLSGGAQAQNIFWQVAGQATLGTTSDFKGIILSKTAVVVKTGAKLNGRALAQTAVTLDADAITAPSGTASTAPAPTTTQPAQTATPTPATATTGSATTTITTPTETTTVSSGSTTTPANSQSDQTGSTTTVTTTTTPTSINTKSTTTVTTPSGSTTTTTSQDNPNINQNPVSQVYDSVAQEQMARNVARGLPTGYVPSDTNNSSSANTQQTNTQPATTGSANAATQPATAQPAPYQVPSYNPPAQANNPAQAGTTKPAAAPTPAPATGGPITDSVGSIANGIGSTIGSVVSWFVSLFSGGK